MLQTYQSTVSEYGSISDSGWNTIINFPNNDDEVPDPAVLVDFHDSVVRAVFTATVITDGPGLIGTLAIVHVGETDDTNALCEITMSADDTLTRPWLATFVWQEQPGAHYYRLIGKVTTGTGNIMFNGDAPIVHAG